MPLTTPAEIANITADLNAREPKQQKPKKSEINPKVLTQLFADSTAVTGNTTENTFSNGTIVIPANTIKANDAIELLLWFTSTNNANVKTARVKLGSTTLFAVPLTSGGNWFLNKMVPIRSVNGANNVMRALDNSSGYTGLGSLVFSTIDFTQAQTLTVTMQLATTTDSVTLNGIMARIYRNE